VKKLALAATSLLCGCSLMGLDRPEALNMGGGRYAVTGTALSSSIEVARGDAVERANEFCAASSHQAVIESFNDKVHGGTWGEPTSSAVFYCK
jgi:hypothetical protein